MDNKFLEHYYEKAVLPLYGDAVTFTKIVWKDHGKVDLDVWAHYFDDEGGREYVLLYEDFPGGNYLNDDMTHDVIKCGNDTSVHVTTSAGTNVDNIFGYFTLYAEKQR